jgi:hypothetical protein
MDDQDLAISFQSFQSVALTRPAAIPTTIATPDL